MTAYARRLTHDADAAQDLAQAALTRAWRAFGSFDGENFLSWCKTIAFRLHLNAVRGAARRPESLDGECGVEEASDADSAYELLASGVIDEEILRALDELPAYYARAVMLVDLGGLSYAQAAREEATMEGTVKSRLFRGRALLRPLLAGYAQREYGL